MFKLYYAPGTCALASHIALEEAGASYTAERLDFKNSQQTTPAISCDQSEGAGAGAGDGPRHLDRNTGNSRFHCEQLSKGKAGCLMIPSRSRRRSPSTAISVPRCTSIMRTRCAAIAGRCDESSFADMKRKVPETMAASFALIERDMIKGPWVMGEQYTVCDPYLYTIALWLEGDGVDLAALPKVAAHRKRMSERPGGAEGAGRGEGLNL